MKNTLYKLTLILSLAVFVTGNVWGQAKYYLFTPSNGGPAHTGSLSGDFYCQQSPSSDTRKIDAVDFSHCVAVSANTSLTASWTNQYAGKATIDYDMKTTSASFTVYVYNANGSSYGVCKAEAQEGSAPTSFSQVGSSFSGSGQKISFDVSATTNKRVRIGTNSSSNVKFYQIIVEETGTALPQPAKGTDYILNFTTTGGTRYSSTSGSGSVGYIDGIEIKSGKDCKYNANTCAFTKNTSSHYITFTTNSTCHDTLIVTTSKNFSINTSNAFPVSTTASGTKIVLSPSTTYWIMGQSSSTGNSDVTVTSLEFRYPRPSGYTLTASATVVNPNSTGGTGGITATITNSPVTGISSGTTTSTSSNTFTVAKATPVTVTAPATVDGSEEECDYCTYRFDSWENIPATVTADVSTIHAKYNTTYNITYNKDGGEWVGGYSAPAYYVYGTGATLPTSSNITKDGYTFDGWTLSGSAPDLVSGWGNITLDANWSAACTTPTVNFVGTAYENGTTLDLRELWTSNSSGAVTYTVQDANGTGATITDGYKFTATTNGTCTVRASQAADATYCASGDKDITITVCSAVKRIYMVCGGTWCGDSPKFFAHTWGGAAEYDGELMVTPCSATTYYVDVPSDETSVIFTRQSPSSTGLVWEGGNFWNKSQTQNCNSNNQFTFNSWTNDDPKQGIFTPGAATTYTITYNVNGGSGSMSNETGITCGGSKTLTENNGSITRSGWTFTGWNTSKYGTGTAYADGATIEGITANITLYAQWEKEVYMQATGDLSWWYDGSAWFAIYYWDSGATSNNGYVTMEADECGGSLYKATLPGNGYDKLLFLRMDKDYNTPSTTTGKWNQTSDQTYPTTNPMFTINGGSAQACTGSWGAPPIYTISFDANGGTGTMEDITHICSGNDKTIPANTFTREGWVFTGWNTEADGSGTGYSAGDDFSLTSDATLYAQWEKTIYLQATGDYTWWYNKNGDDEAWFSVYYWKTGETGAWVTMELADECSSPAIYKATLPGNNFDKLLFVRKTTTKTTGWDGVNNQSVDITYPTTNDQYTITGTDNSKVTGSWGTYSAPTFTISFANGGGSGSMSSIEDIACDANQAITANSFTKTGYNFSHWTADVDVKVGGATISAGSAIANSATIQNIQSNITLTAQWEEITYSITYNCDGASSGCPSDVASATVLPSPLPSAPTKSGYTFVGWFTNSAKTTAAVAGAALTANTTMYAKWAVNLPGTINKANVAAVSADMTYYNTSYFDYGPSDAANTGRWAEWDIYLTPDEYTVSVVVDFPDLPNSHGWDIQLLDNEDNEVSSFTGERGVDGVKNRTYDNTWDLSGKGAGLYKIKVKNNVEWAQPKLQSVTFAAAVKYTLTYDANGGSCATESATQASSGASITLPTPTKSGYTCTGWWTDSSGGTKRGDAGGSYTPTSAETLYAQWECTTPTFGTNLSTSEVNYDKNAVASALTVAATANGGTVTYQWYSNTANSTSSPTPSPIGGATSASYTPSTSSVGTTYYFCTATNTTGSCSANSNITPVTVAQTYTVSYEYNGATSGNGTASATASSVTLPTPTKTDYDFDGWYNTAGTKVGDGGDTYNPTADITLYARWQSACAAGSTTIISYTIDEACNSSKNPPCEKTATGSIGGTAYLYLMASSNDAYKLNSDGAYFALELSTGYFQAGDVLTMDGSKAMHVYTGTHGSGSELGVTSAPSEGVISYTLPNTLPSNTSELYVYRSGSTYNGTLTYMTITRSGGGTCYHVYYHGNGAESGFISDPGAYANSATPTVLDYNSGSYTLTKDGYTFQGWATSAEGSVAKTAGQTVTISSADVHLYAVWAEDIPCTAAPTVTAGSNSSVTTTTATVTCANGISAIGTGSCTITSYGFVLGTSANPTLSNTQHEVGTSYTVTGKSFYKNLTGLTPNTTYYIRPYATNGSGTDYGTQTSFTTLATYTMTYDGSNAASANVSGTGSAPTDSNSPYAAGSTVTVLGNTGSLTKTMNSSSATFLGWNTNSDTYSGDHYNAGETFTISGNTTLYAVWGYALNYNTDDGTINESYPSYYISIYPEEGNITTLPSDVTKTGYDFDGWKTQNGKGSTVTAINGNYTGAFDGDYALKAMWTAKEYSIMLNAGNGTGGSSSVTMTYNSPSHTDITAPSLSGYTFAGWYTGEGGTGSMVMNASGTLQASVDGYTDGSGNWTKDATTTLYAKYAAVYQEGYLYITDVMATPEAKAGYTITMAKNSANYNGTLGSTLQTNRAGYEYWADATGSSGTITLSFSDALPASATAGGMIIDVWWGADSNNRTTSIALNGGSAEQLDAANTSTGDRDIVKKATYATELKSLSSITLSCSGGHTVWFRIGIKDRPGYLLTYDDGDGSGAPAASYQPNATITLSSTEPTRDGFTFAGWQVDGSGTVYAPGDEFSMPAEAVTLVAKWLTSITPSLTYPTLYVDPIATTASPTLTGNTGSGTAAYSVTSATPEGCVMVNVSTGEVTAVAAGTATITVNIAASDTYAAGSATCDVTVAGCESWEEIAGVTATAKNAGTPSGSLIAETSGYGVKGNDWKDKTSDGGCGTGAKLGGGGDYVFLTLSSGNYFRNGDKVIIDLAKTPDIPAEGTKVLNIYVGSTSIGGTPQLVGTKTTPICGKNEIILSNVPANTSSITLYRNGDDMNPWVISMKVYRQLCDDGLAKFTGNGANANWSNIDNWVGGKVPTIEDRAVVYKPMMVNVVDAQAKEVILDKHSTNTGALTVDAGKALVIANTLKKTTDGSTLVATAAADVVINSTRAAGTGALIMGGYTSGDNEATVNFETKVKRDGEGWINQFIGSPFSNCTPYLDYAIQMYQYTPDGSGNYYYGYYNTLSEGDEMKEFVGYNILYNDANYLDVEWTGSLNASNNVTLNSSNVGLYYGDEKENLVANSWTAPIHIGEFEDDDFTNVEKTIYILNAGTPEQNAAAGAASQDASDPGTYMAIPINSASWIDPTVTVIPAMQGFVVNATGASPSLTLNYNRLVYSPALTDVGIIPTRLPKRDRDEAPDVVRLRVQGENGWSTTAYVLGREDFTEGFDDGWDGRFLEGEPTAPQLYAPTSDGNMVVNSVPEIEGTVMNFKAGSADNSYTMTFNYNGDENWYLNDQKEQKSTLISSDNSYSFYSANGDNEARFVISKTPINKVATGCDNIETGETARKILINDHVYIIRGGRMYSVDGAIVK